MTLKLRKIVTYAEDTRIEGGKEVPQSFRLFAAAAVLRNPWSGCDFVEDLSPEIGTHAPELGEVLTAEILRLAGGGELVEGYGKAAIVGHGRRG